MPAAAEWSNPPNSIPQVLDLHVQIVSITRHLELSPEQRDQMLTEILLWPELLTFGNRLRTIQRHQQELAELLLKGRDMSEVHERQVPEEPTLGKLTIELTPPFRSKGWREPVELTFDFVEWEHENARIAYFPALEIEVVTTDKDNAPVIREEHVRTAILRGGHAENLFRLALLQRATHTEIQTSQLNLYPETSKERFERGLGGEVKESELRKVAIDMTLRGLPQAYHYEHHVMRLAQMLTGRRAMSVLLVGPPGVGKTAIIQELVRQRSNLKLDTYEFWKTSGARIVAGQSGFGDWQQRCQRIAEEARERKAILYFGNLAELLETGRAGGSSENIASFFRPRMVRGELLVIMECTPEQLTAIEKRDPRVLDGLRQLKIEEPDQKTAFEILHSVALKRLIHLHNHEYNEDALLRIDALHRRYHGYSAYPGKPLRFLDRLCFDPPAEGSALTLERVNQAFSAETGLPIQLLEDSIQMDLEKIRSWFQERLMGQPRAVSHVVDTIAMIKARLSRPGKPLGSFLFVGPTGVGKTELAKCLAEFFYNSRERMIRIDMSEYHGPGSATRLVSSNQDQNEGILTSQMRDQPFSVVLLDEFEKADPQVFDIFLQVLGEARLTDGAGRVADFSNAIVIMTSNLGAQSFKAGNTLGFSSDQGEDLGAEDHFTSEAKKIFRPEFFNRIDRIVPFLPLNRETLQGIIAKEVADIQRRDGLRERRLRLDLLEAAQDQVMEHGYDPRFGARPLRRELEQRVLRRVAGELNEDPNRQRGSLTVTDQDCVFQREDDDRSQRSIEISRLDEISKVRRNFQRLNNAAFVNELNSEFYRLERSVARHQATGVGATGEDISLIYARKKQVEDLLMRLSSEMTQIIQLEEALLLRMIGKSSGTAPEDDISALSYESLLIDLYAGAENMPDRALLLFQAEQHDRMFAVAQDYLEVATTIGCEVRVGAYVKKPTEDYMDDEKLLTRPEEVTELEKFFEDASNDVTAIALDIRGQQAHMRFDGESGAHDFEYEDKGGKHKERLVITRLEMDFDTAWLVREDLNKPNFRDAISRRVYSQIRTSWKDVPLGISGKEYYSPQWLKNFLHDRMVMIAERAL